MGRVCCKIVFMAFIKCKKKTAFLTNFFLICTITLTGKYSRLFWFIWTI